MRRSTIVAVMLALLGVALAVAGIAMSVASGASTDPVSDVLYGLNPVVACRSSSGAPAIRSAG